MGTLPPVTDADFTSTVLQSDQPVLVDFWAVWCGPCRMVAPVLQEIADQHSDSMKFVQLNVDENPETAAAYRVTSIPTINVYQGGRIVRQIIGAKPKSKILAELQEFIA